jgi:diguanylate cyclase (GGDEF)-like protein
MSNSFDADVISQLLGFVERTSDLVGVVDEQSRVLYLNEAARKRLGVGDSAGLTTADLFPPQAFVRYYDEVRPALLRFGTWHGDLAVLTASGEAVAMAMTVVARVGPGGEVDGLVTLGREIATPSEAALASNLIYDEVTDLPGRSIFDDRLGIALRHAVRDGRTVAVILADVDAMKDINDSFGHAVGDDVLRETARRLSRGMRSGDTVARLGGDEFVVLVDGLDEADTVWQVAERLCDAVCRAPVEGAADAVAVTASFGLAVATPDDVPAELLERADAAMYRAKAMGGAKVVVFEDGADVSIATLVDELAHAVSHGQMRPHVQSVVDLQTGVLVGYQGIARWEHPRRGLLDAGQFIHLAANTPIIPVIDLAVLRRTAAAAARTARNGLRVCAYGHLSRRLIGDVDIERYLSALIEDLGITPSDLCVEIAHTLVARPSRTVQSTLRALREIGVRTVLSGVDGQCDANEIVEYEFNQLRLSPRLVRDASRDSARRRVAHGTIALARSLGLTVIAAGVETDSERVDMRDAGCDYGQGTFFGSVQPAGAIA